MIRLDPALTELRKLVHTEPLAQNWASLPFIKREIQRKAWSMRISRGKCGPCAGLGEINAVNTQVWKIRICHLKSVHLQSDACEMWGWDSVQFPCCLSKRNGMLSIFPISLPVSIRQTTATCVVSYETSHSCHPLQSLAIACSRRRNESDKHGPISWTLFNPLTIAVSTNYKMTLFCSSWY